MSNHQSYLEAPYDRQAAYGDAFERYCEEFDLDPDAPETESGFEEYLDDREEDAVLQKAEARAELDEERWDNFERGL